MPIQTWQQHITSIEITPTVEICISFVGVLSIVVATQVGILEIFLYSEIGIICSAVFQKLSIPLHKAVCNVTINTFFSNSKNFVTIMTYIIYRRPGSDGNKL